MPTTKPLPAQGAKPRRSSQNAELRYEKRIEFDDALATVGRIEASAGPTLQRELARSKRLQSAYQSGQDREQFRRRRLGHRSGLVRLMVNELGPNPTLSDRAWSYAQHILKVSANVAAVTGSPWKSTATWLRSNIPALTDEMAIHMKVAFDAYVDEAHIELAKRIPFGDPNLFTGPTPADVAREMAITAEQLRVARANRCGLTSIDPPDRKATDRERKAQARTKAGMMKQSDRNSKAEMQALADRLGCGISTLYLQRRKGTLDAFVAARSRDDTKVSAVIRTLDVGQIGITAANDDEMVVTPHSSGTIQAAMVAANDDAPPAPLSEFIGRNITLKVEEVAKMAAQHPVLAGRMHDHLAELEGPLSRMPPANRKQAMRKMVGLRSKLVRSRQRFYRASEMAA